MSSRLGGCGVLLSFAALLTPTASAADKETIDRAVARGVTSLKQMQRQDGLWAYHEFAAGGANNHSVGATALAALTLIECGVPADDPAVRNAAAALRQVALRLTHTYSLALCNMFFDRLGDPGDVALIESITVRLLAGQSSFGGWGYFCPDTGEDEARRLSTHLARQVELVGKRELPKPAPKRTPSDLPKEIRDQLARISNRPAGGFGEGGGMLSRDDNSNTQFAVLGLWVSRRHGLPADGALARADRHFRRTQNADGGWGYVTSHGAAMGVGTGSTPAMTCAGLLGLAMGHGVANEATLRTEAARPRGVPPAKAGGRNVEGDQAVRAGLALLSTAVGVASGKRHLPPLPYLRPAVVNPAGRGTPDYYFLWSLERVAMTYDLKTLGRKDWYAWGAEVLLDHQEPTGGWSGKYAACGADTCFALLFLCRSNLAQDLTTALRGKLRDREVQLRSIGFKDLGKAAPADSASTAPAGAPPLPPREPVAAAALNRPAPKVILPPAGVPAAREEWSLEVRRLTDALVRAPAARQTTVLTELVESKGSVYTDALAAAIAQLEGEAKQKARDGLVRRLARMTAATLRDKVKDDDAEVRRAAALAVELKGERKLLPDLIGLLEDADRPVARAAQAALKEMAGQDFGPGPQATPAERAQAAARWKAWWAKQKPD